MFIFTLFFLASSEGKASIFEEAIDTISRFNQLTLHDALKTAQNRVEILFSNNSDNPEVKDEIKTLQNYLKAEGIKLEKQIDEIYLQYKDNLNDIIKSSERNFEEKSAEMKQLGDSIFIKLQEFLQIFEKKIEQYQQEQVARFGNQLGSGRSFFNLIGLGDALRNMIQVSGEQLAGLNTIVQTVFRFTSEDDVLPFITGFFGKIINTTRLFFEFINFGTFD